MPALLSIADFGAVADGRTLNSQAIQAAIDAAAKGGGTVYVPPGTWLCGGIVLKSGVTLQLDAAAVLLGSRRLEDYPTHEANIHEGVGRFFIAAFDAEDIGICGAGVIDGVGEAFWQAPKGSEWWGTDNVRVCPMFEFRNCRRLRLTDIRIRNSPGWTVHPFCCDQVVIRGITIENNPFGPNTDGLDIDGCRDVFVSDCKLSCGDDAIIIKATPKARSTERVVITNCVCFSNCIGIGIGQETQSDIRQIAISNCVIHQSHRLITIGIWDGGVVEDVTVSNIVGDTNGHYSLARPLQFEIKQNWQIPQTRPLGVIRNVTVSGLTCRTQGRILATAQAGAWIDNLTLRDIRLDYSFLEDAYTASPPDGRKGSSQYANENLEARRQNAAVVLEHCRGLELDGLRVHWPKDGGVDTAKGGPRRAVGSPEPAYGVLWARQVLDSRIEAPFARASRPGQPAAVLDGCGSSHIRLGA